MACAQTLTQCRECKRARQPASRIGRQLLAPGDDKAAGLSTGERRAALRQEGLCLAGCRGQGSQTPAEIGRGTLDRHRAV